MNVKEAELLYSRYLDNELNAEETDLLLDYMANHPDWVGELEDWRRMGDRMRQDVQAVEVDVDRAWSEIQAGIHAEKKAATVISDSHPAERPKLVRFYQWLSYSGAAAAAIVIGWLSMVLFNGIPSHSEADYLAAAVEYVETDIEGASSVVYVDQDSGWTIVWVDEPVRSVTEG